MTLKLQFSTDFTDYIGDENFSGSVKVVTKSEIIECSAVLLAQHSPILREMLKEDNELFLTDSNHVRECLSILYGGSVELTEENFHDILKFMVLFDIKGASEKVLHWMTDKKWNLDNASLLINSSIKVAKGAQKSRISEFSVLLTSRLFFEIRMKAILDPNSTDIRYKSLDSAMEYLIPRVEEKKELLKLLFYEELIPDYIPWIIKLVDYSNYKILMDSLEVWQISNRMALLDRSQFVELFDRIEDLENLSLKDYKKLNKCKLIVNEKMTILKSLRFMKENQSIYSCWKMLDKDGMAVLTHTFTDILDQFLIIECIFSWKSVNQDNTYITPAR